MRPIRKGDRGAAVEDVQRRLVLLGADLGPTGIDGVFLGATQDAVTAFQREHRLGEDGEVGSRTWAALVDATFSLGDRLLYLRFPYLHGADVRVLQNALNALGFACGASDGIFGAFTERAVRDFQSNTGLAADGIVGPGTARAVEGLRHVWSDKTARPPVELRVAPARSAAILLDHEVWLVVEEGTLSLAERLVNLARAAEQGSRLRLAKREEVAGPGVTVMELTDRYDRAVGRDVIAVAVGDGGSQLSLRLAGAVREMNETGARIVVLVDRPDSGEHALQSLAVSLVDGLCLGLSTKP